MLILISRGRTVMVEQVSNSIIRGIPVSSAVMAVFELDEWGRIQQWREAYDLKSATDQIATSPRGGHPARPGSGQPWPRLLPAVVRFVTYFSTTAVSLLAIAA
ncbi:hypothetical protein H7K38_09650 [Mycobacterium alsense]|uniref:Uncharacterized protein n=1 Tax=Mycobacterium alsense TaxID=324058 RepID=A0AA41XPM8_9MYCO|nr:hypothetical protein [Mycobacterium alsense]MCV7378919.1 hypothetical protein [Mycobacterium alsense]